MISTRNGSTIQFRVARK